MVSQVPHEGGAAVTRVMYSPDGRAIISASATGGIVVSSATAGSSLRVLSDHAGACITCFDIVVRVVARASAVLPAEARCCCMRSEHFLRMFGTHRSAFSKGLRDEDGICMGAIFTTATVSSCAFLVVSFPLA